MASAADQQPWFLRSTYPVDFPVHDALTKSRAEFDAFLADQLARPRQAAASAEGELRGDLAAMALDNATQAGAGNAEADPKARGAFMQGLVDHGRRPSRLPPNTKLTANADVALRSSTNPLVDLFAELEDVTSGRRLQTLLDAAWAEDASATLKIIFNARSIHLGKGSRNTFYRAAGWLAQAHPLTLVANLGWLSRPVIEKKAGVVVEDARRRPEGPVSDDSAAFDVRHGVAHGYWKDLLNMLVLAVRGKLDVLADPRDVLNSADNPVSHAMRLRRARRSGRAPLIDTCTCPDRTRPARAADAGTDPATRAETPRGSSGSKNKRPKPDAKQERREARGHRHAAAVAAFSTQPVYRALHLAVARLFAQQLRADLQALGDSSGAVSPCAKWAPSQDHFHDRHTLVAGSIAELLHPRASGLVPADAGRETYLRHAREQYRRSVSALRAHLGVVERDVTAGTLGDIRYERVPSLAMDRHCVTFAARDARRFAAYIERVAEGRAAVSGAALLPSTLVARARAGRGDAALPESAPAAARVRRRVRELEARVADGQWRTLVARVRDSGSLSSSLAVCDVSGSMAGPVFRDGSCPLDSALGLSLLVAEVTEPPFGGAFVTFSDAPAVQTVDATQALDAKLRAMEAADWGYTTDLVRVFEGLILPMAVDARLPPEAMVRRVFVFSDMHFNQAQGVADRWTSSFERIKRSFADAGYALPELVFWNLAGGRAGAEPGAAGSDDGVAPKPVAATQEGTSLVSGYSQGLLKVFLDGAGFDDPDEGESAAESDDDVVIVGPGEGDAHASGTRRRARNDPLRTVKRAIGHEAYAMLRVMD